MTRHGLRKGRRYAFAECVIIAAVLPGELITMAMEAVPLYVLYEASLLIATVAERRQRSRQQRAETAPASGAAGV